MPKGKSDKPVFKTYDQSQLKLLPPHAAELIPENHLVRVVNEVIDKLDVQPLLDQYARGGGASRYHPLMLLKVFVFSYMSGIYSSRKIAKALRENINFMWLSGRQRPDFRTLNTFRKERLAPVIEEVFIASVKLLSEAGYVSLRNFFLDGTKIEANANRYTFVWRRAVDAFDKRIDEKLREYLGEARRIADQEDLEYGDRDLEEMGNGSISSELVEQMADELSGVLKQLNQKQSTGVDSKKKVKTIEKTVRENYLPRKRRYASVRPLFQGRNSYSKTDLDATFMHMKEDHMRNGQLKPAYNVQVGTENGFVTSYGMYSNPTDTRTLKPHLEQFRKAYGHYPRRVIADSGYGSEENYSYLEAARIEGYVKYNLYQKEKKKSFAKQRYTVSRWPYDRETDTLTCPEGHPVSYEYTKSYRTEVGYETTRRIYRCDQCDQCPVRSECTKSSFRMTAFSPQLWQLKRKARRRLDSGPGYRLYKRRGHEIETVFGQIKANQNFKQFLLRGKQGVSTEWGLLMLGYNMKRIARAQI